MYLPLLQAGYKIDLQLFDEISKEIPLLSTIYPSHDYYSMPDFDKAGGVRAVLKELAKEEKINVDVNTITGRLKDRIEETLNKNEDVIRPVSNPYPEGGIAVLRKF